MHIWMFINKVYVQNVVKCLHRLNYTGVLSKKSWAIPIDFFLFSLSNFWLYVREFCASHRGLHVDWVYKYFNIWKHKSEIGQIWAYRRPMLIYMAVVNTKIQLNVTGSNKYLLYYLSSCFVITKVVCKFNGESCQGWIWIIMHWTQLVKSIGCKANSAFLKLSSFPHQFTKMGAESCGNSLKRRESDSEW